MSSDHSSAGETFCISCGVRIDPEVAVCRDCGVRQDPSVLNGPSKHCAVCAAEIKLEAEICPECGVRQEGGTAGRTDSPDGKPGPGEALSLVVVYYQHHPWRGLFHFLLTVFTAGGWGLWFGGFWVGTMLGFKNVDGMRRLRSEEAEVEISDSAETAGENDSEDEGGWLHWFFNGDLFG